MTSNAALVRRWFEEVWNQQRPQTVEELAAPDIVIHGLDITAALDLPRSADDEATRVVLDSLTDNRDATPFGVGLAGWHLVATDIDWQHGDGLPVTATSDELILALAGRPRPGIELRKDVGTPAPTG